MQLTLLTFDLDNYRSLCVANLVDSRADVFPDVIKGGLGDMNHLVEVLYPHPWLHRQFLPVFGPGDVRSRPVVNTVFSRSNRREAFWSSNDVVHHG